MCVCVGGRVCGGARAQCVCMCFHLMPVLVIYLHLNKLLKHNIKCMQKGRAAFYTDMDL